MLRGPAAARDGETDSQGRYDFGGVPPATYELQLIPPAVFDAERLSRTVEVRDPRACAAADFNLAYNGSIRRKRRILA